MSYVKCSNINGPSKNLKCFSKYEERYHYIILRLQRYIYNVHLIYKKFTIGPEFYHVSTNTKLSMVIFLYGIIVKGAISISHISLKPSFKNLLIFSILRTMHHGILCVYFYMYVHNDPDLFWALTRYS